MKIPFGLLEPLIIAALPAIVNGVTGEIPAEHQEKKQMAYLAVACGGTEVKKYVETATETRIDDAAWAKFTADAKADMEAAGCPHLFAEVDAYIQLDAL